MATEAISGYYVLKSVCEKLGIEPRMVRRLLIDIAVDQVVTVYVQRYVGAQALGDMVKVLVPTLDATAADSPNGAAEKVKAQPYFIETTAMDVDAFGKVTYTRNDECRPNSQ